MKLHLQPKENTHLKKLLTHPQTFFVSVNYERSIELFLVIAIMGFFMKLWERDITGMLISGSVLLIWTIFGYIPLLIKQRDQVIIGQEGIIYSTAKYTVYSPWHNIQRVVPSPHNGAPCLQLQQHAQPMLIEQGIHSQTPALANTFSRTYPITDHDELYNYIPIGEHSIIYKASLWNTVVQYAPHIKDTYVLT